MTFLQYVCTQKCAKCIQLWEGQNQTSADLLDILSIYPVSKLSKQLKKYWFGREKITWLCSTTSLVQKTSEELFRSIRPNTKSGKKVTRLLLFHRVTFIRRVTLKLDLRTAVADCRQCRVFSEIYGTSPNKSTLYQKKSPGCFFTEICVRTY